MSGPSQSAVMWSATKTMFDLFRDRDELTGVQILLDDPGDQMRDQTIWLDGIETTSDIDEFGGPRLIREDTIEVTVMIRCAGFNDNTSAWERLMELLVALDEVLVLHADLDDAPGVLSAIRTQFRCRCPRTPDGIVGYGEVTVEIKTQLS